MPIFDLVDCWFHLLCIVKMMYLIYRKHNSFQTPTLTGPINHMEVVQALLDSIEYTIVEKVVTHSCSLQYHLKEDEIYFASCSLHLFFLMLSWGVFPCDHQHCSLRLILNKCFTFLKIILKRGLKKKVY